MKRPNILYLHSHDTGRYIQPYGHPVPTPALQEFAEEAVLFRSNFCVNPTCSPSRASLATGLYPHQSGMFGLANGCALKSMERRDFGLFDYSQHWVTLFNRAGYDTALSGIQHEDGPVADLSIYGDRIGYGRIRNKEFKRHGWDQRFTIDLACDYIKERRERPFFLSVGTQETHVPLPGWRRSEDPRYCRPLEGFPDTPETREDAAQFKASARVMDAKFGAVLDALRDAGADGETIVIITTDHGIPLPDMKCNLTDGGIGTMLMIRAPGDFTGGTVIDAMTTHLDVLPTVCELADIEPPDYLEGRSLVPLVRGEVTTIHEEIFAEVNYHAKYEPLRGVRTARWKYIRRYHDTGQQSCDGSHTKELYLRRGWAERPLDDEMLYDLFFDPYERCNLAGDSRVGEMQRDLSARLRAWMERTGDPLLHGAIPEPGVE